MKIFLLIYCIFIFSSGSIAVLQENSIELYENLNELIWRVESKKYLIDFCRKEMHFCQIKT